MISKAKLQRYKEFNGELEDWVRSQKDGLDSTLTGDEWLQIDKVVQRLKIQRNGTASLDYRNETDRLLKKIFENPEAILFAKGMA